MPPVAAAAGTGRAELCTRSIGRASVAASTGMSALSSMCAATLLPGEELLVHAIALDDPPAHGLHAAVHRLVAFEDPAHLAAADDVARSLVEVVDVEPGSHPRVLVLGLDAEREDAHVADLALPGQ